MRSETSRVQYGRTTIDYRVVRSGRQKTVAVAVDPHRGVVVTAPVPVTIERLDAIVHRKAQWIVEHLRLVKAAATTPTPREFVSGESYLYLGRHYRLKVLPWKGAARVALCAGWLLVEGHGDVRGALLAWYRAHAEAKLGERVALWHQRVGVPLPKVVVRDQAKRWASCDHRGTLRFNWRVIQVPMSLVDYVVVHELVHLRHRDHDKRFWALLGRVMPDYEARWERLKGVGAEVGW